MSCQQNTRTIKRSTTNTQDTFRRPKNQIHHKLQPLKPRHEEHCSTTFTPAWENEKIPNHTG